RINVSASHVYGDTPGNGQSNYPVSIRLRGASRGELLLNRSANITNANPEFDLPTNREALLGSPYNLSFTIKDPGFAQPNADPPTQETFTADVFWGDGQQVLGVEIPISQTGNATRATLANANLQHTYTAPGTYQVRVIARDDDGGLSDQRFDLVVAEPGEITAKFDRASTREDAGQNAAMLEITRSGSVSQNLVVQMLSLDPTEAIVVGTATIFAGSNTVSVPITAVDDRLLDGTQTVTFRISAAALSQTVDVPLQVTDAEQLSVSVAEQSVREDAGSLAVTVSRSDTDSTTNANVRLDTSDPRIPASDSIMIPAGVESLQVEIPLINDDVLQAPTPVVVAISADGYASGQTEITLQDDQPSGLQNPENPFNVDATGGVFAIDALLVINALSANGGTIRVGANDTTTNRFLDVNGNFLVSALDALLVITELSRIAREGENTGENPSETILPSIHNERETDAALLELLREEASLV
ncbi:MAG: dockerin type I domain-containing protein, partial [Planctomycetota bacterium]